MNEWEVQIPKWRSEKTLDPVLERSGVGLVSRVVVTSGEGVSSRK